LLFSPSECLEFETAVVAHYGSRCDDGNEEDRLRYRGLDFLVPERARIDGLLVLEEPEILCRAAELASQFAADAIAQRRQRALGVLVVLSRVAEESDEFRTVS